jgi:methyl-accepting chemotaxis protein
MTAFYNLRTGTKLALGFGLCLMLAAAVSAVSVSCLSQQNQITQAILAHHLKGTNAAAQASACYSAGLALVVGLAAATILIGATVAWLITRHVTAAFAAITRQMATLDRDNKSMQSTVAACRSDQDSILGIVRSLQGSAGDVYAAAYELSAIAMLVGAGSDEISTSMAEVAQGSEQSARGAAEVAQGCTSQAQLLGQGSTLVRQLVEAVQSVATDAEIASQATDRANSAAEAGGVAVAQTVAGMQRIQTTVNQSAAVIRNLGETSSQIGAIVGAIEDIADQTNLLALNAAIEAARAGEAGRGFAVVADEVRKLAERSRSATQEIGSLIGQVQKQTSDAVVSMEAGTREVESGTVLAYQAGESLSQIQSVVSEAASQVTSICAAAEEMLASSEEVAASITETAAIVEESSASAEEMSAAAEQVSASTQNVASSVAQQGAAIEELAAASDKLLKIAETLQAATAEFKVSNVADECDEAQEAGGTAMRKAA